MSGYNWPSIILSSPSSLGKSEASTPMSVISTSCPDLLVYTEVDTIGITDPTCGRDETNAISESVSGLPLKSIITIAVGPKPYRRPTTMLRAPEVWNIRAIILAIQ
ncbi:hypothetical protein HRbin02_01809 [Candidatus Calditenuaceae archaeon HR02]|nr:hypothetical protein HRbin02_01809 [Candidatus Calditenuaceae archaeon HR02]